ncbi:MAG TPA: hypothetical protein VKE69_10870, partial [Planctomycetota bacterium]|nr:hypothetical protein [Planctomycetota bacterium]
SFLDELRRDAVAADELLAKLRADSQARTLGPEPFSDPGTGRPLRLAAVDESGVRLEPTTGSSRTATVVPFDKLASGARFASLLARAVDRSRPDQCLRLARASLLATLAFDASEIVRYQRSMPTGQATTDPPPALAADGYQAAIDAVDAATAAGADPAECAALRGRIERERAAATGLARALGAFATGRFGEAERALAELLVTGRRTVLLALASDGTTPFASEPR